MANNDGFSIGRIVFFVGVGIAAMGAILLLIEKSGFPLGRLPGDIHIQGEKGTFYFPIVTSIVISIVGTLLIHLFKR